MKAMKPYKIDLSGFTGKVRELVSAAVQKKAFELGVGWKDGGKRIENTDSPYLYFEKKGYLLCGYIKETFEADINILITADAFLAMTTAKDEPKYKIFKSEVLVRNGSLDVWSPAIFGCKSNDETFPYTTVGGNAWMQCIPYEGNESLLGTTDSPE